MVLGRDITLDALILVAVAWYARRLLREQRQPVATLWVLPALLALVAALQRDRLPVARPAAIGVAVADPATASLTHACSRRWQENTPRSLLEASAEAENTDGRA
ncbi:MAG: hypothetical protein M3Q65_06805 [Chloroflexota bacterium]|nr:hypothetical protein [Chloroflexota bacterium]